MSESKYTLEEISRHNGVLDTRVWILIRESVYDVTDYLSMHPGGSELIMEYAGKDATAAFNDFGHSSDAIHSLKSYKIGEIIKDNKFKNNHERKITKNIINGENVTNTKGRYRRISFPLFSGCSS